MAYNYIRIVHVGQDYITVKVGKKEYEIQYEGQDIIRKLLVKIRSMELMNPVIKEKNSFGSKYLFLELPKDIKLNWGYFHKFFRTVDGKNEKEQKAINAFYNAYRDLPDHLLDLAEESLLSVYREEGK